MAAVAPRQRLLPHRAARGVDGLDGVGLDGVGLDGRRCGKGCPPLANLTRRRRLHGAPASVSFLAQRGALAPGHHQSWDPCKRMGSF